MIEVTRQLVGVLKDKQRSLELQIRDREAIQVERLADPIDISTAQSNRDSAASNINRAVTLLREVNGALGRIEDGTFGICLGCGEDIPEKRRLAVPWAGRCVSCQEAYDNELKAEEKARRLPDRKATLFDEIKNREEGRSVRG